MIVYYLVKLSPCLNALYAAAILVTNPLIFIKAGGHLRKWKPLCVRACGCVCVRVWMRVDAVAPLVHLTSAPSRRPPQHLRLSCQHFQICLTNDNWNK